MPRRKRKRDLTAQPHNAIVAFTFSQREHAAGLLKGLLDPSLVALVRWSTLKLESIHFVDRTLRGRYADLFYSAEMGDERVYFEVLLEHQSSVEALMILRMGAILFRRWEKLYREEPARTSVPLIIPVLLHHSETGWTAKRAFQDIVAVPDAARPASRRFIPQFEMDVIDVSHDPSGGLVMAALTALGKLVLWCLSVAGDEERFQRELDRLVVELNALYADPKQIDALIAVLRYLVATHPKLGVTTVTNLLETTAMKGRKEAHVDVLDELKREGREEGREEGRAEGRAEGRTEEGARILLMQLAARFGPVPRATKERILAATPRMLERWSLRVLTARTLDAVFRAGASPKKPAKRPQAHARRPAASNGGRSASL